jgi:general secretion pathway protein A
MYASFFGLKQAPFSITPDPRYLFMSERHREALAHLLYGVDAGGGFVLLSGEIGAGKTTVCRCFLEQIPRRCNVAYIFNPKLTVMELLKSVCEEFGLPPIAQTSTPPTVKDYVDPLNAFLLRTHGVGQNNVLVIDEAQMLSVDVLEQLRLLTNLETSERKLLQIILIGQPELRDMLARPELEQLEQRVIARYHLGALGPAETEQYIRHRLAVAGMNRPMPFDAKALRRIHELARGVPRRINLLCDRALLGAYALGKPVVDRGMVEHAASEVFGQADRPASARNRRDWRSIVGLSALTAAAVTAAVLLISTFQRSNAPDAPQLARRGAVAASAAASRAASAPPPSASTPAVPAGASQAPPSPVAAAAAVAGGATAPVVLAQVEAPSPAAFLTTASLHTQFPLLTRDESSAWRLLATSWQLQLDGGDPCISAQASSVHCFRTNSASLDLIRHLDRPGIVTLRDSTDKPVYALLTGLGRQTATLQIGQVSQTVSLVSLATLWRGDFATYWRVPQGYDGKPADGTTVELSKWVSSELGTATGAASRPGPLPGESGWKSQVASFQRAQGLKPDGVAGPTTLMLLNRAAGVNEPRLRGDVQSP